MGNFLLGRLAISAVVVAVAGNVGKSSGLRLMPLSNLPETLENARHFAFQAVSKVRKKQISSRVYVLIYLKPFTDFWRSMKGKFWHCLQNTACFRPSPPSLLCTTATIKRKKRHPCRISPFSFLFFLTYARRELADFGHNGSFRIRRSAASCVRGFVHSKSKNAH